MKSSPILDVTLRWLVVQLLIVSFFLLLRGHDESGGGFSGGLLAASAVIIITIANGVDAGRKLLYFQPLSYIGAGLMLTILVGVMQMNEAFLTAAWINIPLGFTELKLGTPLLFDLGVYIVVLGVVSSFVLEIESVASSTDNKEDEVK